MHKSKILVVEDERVIRDLLHLNLTMDGFDVSICVRGDEVLDKVMKEWFDIIVLDIMLPGKNGIDICGEIKKHRPELPIIILSALDHPSKRIKGLKAGADDYITKPFEYEELLLRIQKQIEKTRIQSGSQKKITIGNIEINLSNNKIKYNDSESHDLTSKETALLAYLYANRNRPISRKEILANVWGYESFPNSRTVDNHITSLRKAFKELGEELFKSERGIGYRLIIND